MKRIVLMAVCYLALAGTASANFVTPGTGVKWTLDSLVVYSGGEVSFSGGEYVISDTIKLSKADTLLIDHDAIVKFVAGTFLDARGVMIVNPPTEVLFTAFEASTGFLGMRLDSSEGSSFKKFTFEYAVSLRVSDCSPVFDSCIIRYNNVGTSTSFGNGAMALFRAHPVITNTSFISNRRAAITGGANISNAPKIINCYLFGNNVLNQNVPQINLGPSGSDTTKILNSQILNAAGIQGGGIGFLPLGNLNAVISGNLIKNNRYGITFQGGSAINSLTSYNVIDSNNTQGNPLAGGSGIAFVGGTATSHQNSIVTGNIIRGNLWGVTVQNFAKPNLGDLSNADTTDDGKNQIYGNVNTSTTPLIQLFNNSPDTIYAQNNYWGTDIASEVEDAIYHIVDDPAKGLVIYAPYMISSVLPVKLSRFDVSNSGGKVNLQWQSTSEVNASHFDIQRSFTGGDFETIGKLMATGTNSEGASYTFNDEPGVDGKVYYRLAMVDKDGKTGYSEVKVVDLFKATTLRLWPNPVKEVLEISAHGVREVKVIGMDGKLHIYRRFDAASNQQTLNVASLPAGMYMLVVSGNKGILSSTQFLKP